MEGANISDMLQEIYIVRQPIDSKILFTHILTLRWY